jgi:hypothetical protein
MPHSQDLGAGARAYEIVKKLTGNPAEDQYGTTTRHDPATIPCSSRESLTSRFNLFTVALREDIKPSVECLRRKVNKRYFPAENNFIIIF